MPRILDSGTPLTGSSEPPSWTALCDSSSTYLPDNTAPAPLVINPPDVTESTPTAFFEELVTSPLAIDHIVVSGTLKGRFAATFGLTLNHDKLGALSLFSNVQIADDSTFTDPYPSQDAVIQRTFNVGDTVPEGWNLIETVGEPAHQQVTLPASENPSVINSNYFFGNVPFAEPVIVSSTAEGPTTTIIVPAHRQPWAPSQNLSETTVNNSNATEPVEFRNVRYVPTITPSNQPSSNTQSITTTQWDDFRVYAADWSEALYSTYNAHQALIVGETEVVAGVGFITEYTIQFIKYPSVTWSVTPMATVTYEFVAPPQGIFQYTPADYADYLQLAERQKTFSVALYDWRNKAIEGLLTLTTGQSSYYYEPSTVTPAYKIGTWGITGLTITVYFKADQPYEMANISPTTNGSATVATTQGNLVAVADDRAMIGIFCAINNSSTMGILCGYAVERTSLTDPTYTISYFIATVCNLGHVNSPRLVQSISYVNQDWSGFSTHGNQGQAYVLMPLEHRIYPVVGELGLQVSISGTRLTFQLLGNYPALVYDDASVAEVTAFHRYSLNA
jgi:hypothetical protein